MKWQSLVLVACAAGLWSSCKTAAPIHPHGEEHNRMCAVYLEEGELVKAQERCELALEFNPDYPEPFNNLCNIWIKRGNLSKAKEMCIKALRLNNDFAEAHSNLGYIYLAEGSLGRAADQFRSALKVNPDYAEARYNLCLVLLKEKKTVQARVCFDKIVETNENIADPHLGLCILHLEDDNFPLAIKECTRAVELNPRFAEAWYHLGLCYQGAGQQCEAVEALQNCLAVEPNHEECRNNINTAAHYCGLLKPHLEEVEETTSAQSAAAGLYKQGCLERDRGRLAEAERTFKKCIKTDGRFGLCHCALAELKRQAAANDEARAWCKKCLAYTSDDQQAFQRETCKNLSKGGGE